MEKSLEVAPKVETAQEAQELIEREAKVKAVAEIRVIPTMEVGQVVRQGDIYIHRVKDDFAHGFETGTRQLALGETVGSRHVAEEPALVFRGVRVPEWCDRDTLLGPCLMAKKRFKVVHPEHAHVDLPAGTYQVTHQMDARTKKAVID
jgi:hypothetical protein